MKITIESTSKIVTVLPGGGVSAVEGVKARLWEGHTDDGIPIHCFVTRIAAPAEGDLSQFETELTAHRAPSAVIEAIPAQVIL